MDAAEAPVPAPAPVAAESLVHRIEALPGTGRYAVTFRRGDGSEQTAVVHLAGNGAAEVAEASLPRGWTVDGAMFQAVVAAVRAVDDARQLIPAPQLRDVEGGWDVSLGNVVADPAAAGGLPRCTAHGAMSDEGGVFVCAECGARALLA